MKRPGRSSPSWRPCSLFCDFRFSLPTRLLLPACVCVFFYPPFRAALLVPDLPRRYYGFADMCFTFCVIRLCGRTCACAWVTLSRFPFAATCPTGSAFMCCRSMTPLRGECTRTVGFHHRILFLMHVRVFGFSSCFVLVLSERAKQLWYMVACVSITPVRPHPSNWF